VFAVVGLFVAAGVFGPTPAAADTFTASNNANLAPLDGNAASATSQINVSGLGGGTLSSASVVLNGVTHLRTTDLDVLLVSPNNVKVILMSDACGVGTAGVNLTLTDSAAAPLPSGACVSGSYRPADHVGCDPGGADVLGPPAPLGIDGVSLSTFNGANPNGTWTLYVADACATETGAIQSGWTLTLNTALPTPSTPAAPLPATTSPAPKAKKKRCKKKGKKAAAARKCKRKR
jgi:subtilisin-like proprotein convertase family protein